MGQPMTVAHITDAILRGLPLKDRRRASKLISAARNLELKLEQIRQIDESPSANVAARMNAILQCGEELENSKLVRKGTFSRFLGKGISAAQSANMIVHTARFRAVAVLYLYYDITVEMAQSVAADVEQVSLDAIRASCRKARNQQFLIFDQANNRFRNDPEYEKIVEAFEAELARRHVR